MKYEYSINSPCKINLSLDIHGKRLDGFHNLTSIFQLVSLEDTITARLIDENKIMIEGSFDCKLEDNLIFKAATSYLKKANIKQGLIFKVKKVIPSGGGIGGGSSNCGAVLRLLNYIYKNVLSDDDLYNIALSLGSDVPFFLSAGTALVEGRGEVITPLNTIEDYYILLVNPGIHISTGMAFNKLSNKNKTTKLSEDFSKELVREYIKGPKNFYNFKNSFELALISDYTFINDIKNIMNGEGSLLSALSGSGSTMFGIFQNRTHAEKAFSVLSLNSLYNIFLVEPLSKYPKVSKRIIY